MNAKLALLVFGSSLIAFEAHAQEWPKRPEKGLLPELKEHRHNGPWAIMPFVEEGGPARETSPYRSDRIRPDAGALETVIKAKRPVQFGMGTTGPGMAYQGHVSVKQRVGDFALTGAAAVEDSDSYQTPGGNGVRSGYQRHSEQAGFAWMPTGRALRVGIVNDVIKDQQQPFANQINQNGVNVTEGSGTDPVSTHRMIGRLRYEDHHSFDFLDSFSFEARHMALDRESNNFKARDATAPNSLVRVKPKADITTLSLRATAPIGPATVRITAKGEREGRNAARRGGPNTSLDQVSGFQFPDVALWRAQFATDAALDVSKDDHFTLSMRYDMQTGDAKGKNKEMRITGMAPPTAYRGTPLSLYQDYFAVGDTQREDHLISGGLQYKRDFLEDRGSATLDLSTVGRAPNARELYFALPSMEGPAAGAAGGTSSRIIGNPTLDAERHYRLEAATTLEGAGWHGWAQTGPGKGASWANAWSASLSGGVAYVEDFITRDRARGQAGVLANDNANIRRNVDATLAHVSADMQWNATRTFSAHTNIGYHWGHNESDDRALYGIAPLEANMILDWHDRLGTLGTWNAGAHIRAVWEQNRLDDDVSRGSGFDFEEADGFMTLDLFAGAQIYDRVGLRFMVENVFDQAYVDPNPVQSTNHPNPVGLPGAGRTFTGRLVANF